MHPAIYTGTYFVHAVTNQHGNVYYVPTFLSNTYPRTQLRSCNLGNTLAKLGQGDSCFHPGPTFPEAA